MKGLLYSQKPTDLIDWCKSEKIHFQYSRLADGKFRLMITDDANVPYVIHTSKQYYYEKQGSVYQVGEFSDWLVLT